jgi:DNA-binding NarL/FixJ family response regulator
MPTRASIAVRSLLVLNADRLYATLLRQYATAAFPHAKVAVADSVDGAELALRAGGVDFFVTGSCAPFDDDALDLVADCMSQPASFARVLFVTTQSDARVLGTLRAIEVDGFFDASHERPEQLVPVLQAIANGERYWTATTLSQMQRGTPTDTIARVLTTLEQLVLTIIGDGRDDASAGLELGLSPATIGTVRRDLHRKLGVQQRGELVRLAAQYGFVRFTPNGVVRPGYRTLAAAYYSRRYRRDTRPAPSCEFAA